MGAEVDQGLFDNKVQLLPALQAFPAFKSKLIFSFEIVHFDLFINSSYSLELMAESFCLFLHRNLIWNLKLPNRRGVERKGGSGGGGGGGGGRVALVAVSLPRRRTQQSDTQCGNQHSGQFGLFINSNRTTLSDLNLFLIIGS